MPPLQESDREPAWRRRKAQRGPEILVAAREVFEESGFEGASLAEVGRRLGGIAKLRLDGPA